MAKAVGCKPITASIPNQSLCYLRTEVEVFLGADILLFPPVNMTAPTLDTIFIYMLLLA